MSNAETVMQKSNYANEAPFVVKIVTGVAVAHAKHAKSIPQTLETQLTNSTSISSSSTQNLLSTQTQSVSQEKITDSDITVMDTSILEISQDSDDDCCEVFYDAKQPNYMLDVPRDDKTDQKKKVIIIGGNDRDAHDSFEDGPLKESIRSDHSADSPIKWYANKQQMAEMRPINAKRPRGRPRKVPIVPPKFKRDAVSISQSGPPRTRPRPDVPYPLRKIVRPVRMARAILPRSNEACPPVPPKVPATIVDWKNMSALEKRGKTLNARKTRSYWFKLIQLQADWIRIVAAKPKIIVTEIGFALNCWKIALRHFSFCKNSFSVEIQKLTLMFLSNSIKILEITIAKGHEEVQEQAINFFQTILKKFIKNPSTMNDYNTVWVRVREALHLIVNHTSDLKNLLVVYSSLIDIQSKFLTSWQKFNRTQKGKVTDQDINFFVYALNEVDALSKAANLRVQQQRRATIFHLAF